MKQGGHILSMIATTMVVAIIVCSCKSKLSVAEALDMSQTPAQVVDEMNIVQTRNGRLEARVLASKMERYDNDTMLAESFPAGIELYSYTENGVLESTIVADVARHEHKKGAEDTEIWKAYGNVVIRNIIKDETMETDTLYWDRKKQEIYTDCYVRMYSKDGFAQGYGMRSDEKVRNAYILKLFNSYTVVVKDSTEIVIDSVNFIGPLIKK